VKLLAVGVIIINAILSFFAGYWVRDRKDPISLEEQRRISAQKWDQDKSQLEANHAWEVRRLTARAEDAEAERDKFKGAYKRAINKLQTMRKEVARARLNLQAAGLGDAAPREDGSPELSTVQGVLDVVLKKIPGIDAMAQELTRSYIEREFRSRGPKAGPDILEEALAGDFQE
jgi:hypothetical protein